MPIDWSIDIPVVSALSMHISENKYFFSAIIFYYNVLVKKQKKQKKKIGHKYFFEILSQRHHPYILYMTKVFAHLGCIFNLIV